MHPTRPRARGFTLIEMMVVISIIVSLMAIGIPALINSQNQADEFATQNVIESVHNNCQRLARQRGSAGLVYGFTLTYNSTGGVSGQNAAASITPWTMDTAGVAHQHAAGTWELQSEFGKIPLWGSSTSTTMSFWDRYRPAATVIIAGTTSSMGNGDSLHVGYEPRSGFPHAIVTAGSSAVPSSLKPGTISDPTSLPNTTTIAIWTTRGQAQSSVVIHNTGVCNAHAGR